MSWFREAFVAPKTPISMQKSFTPPPTANESAASQHYETTKEHQKEQGDIHKLQTKRGEMRDRSYPAVGKRRRHTRRAILTADTAPSLKDPADAPNATRPTFRIASRIPCAAATVTTSKTLPRALKYPFLAIPMMKHAHTRARREVAASCESRRSQDTPSQLF